MKEEIDILTVIAERMAKILMDSESLDTKTKLDDGVHYYTVEDLCSMLHISKATYYRHKDLGFVTPSAYIGRKPLFDQQAINDYLAKFN